MVYSHRNIVEERKEACQKAQRLTAICKQLYITLDPIDWQDAGMRARVTVNAIDIADLSGINLEDSDSILRLIQMKLFEHAALKAVGAAPGTKASVWSPVTVVQPQAFLSLWIITLETNERIAIAEYIRNEQRIYEHYTLNMDDRNNLIQLFGPTYTGEYQIGNMVTIEEHGHTSTGEIVYVLPPNEAFPQRVQQSRGRHTILGKVHLNNGASRYVVDCHDGFPHIVNQWQVTVA